MNVDRTRNGKMLGSTPSSIQEEQQGAGVASSNRV